MNAVTLLSVYIRSKSNVRLVALQECYPKLPALLLFFSTTFIHLSNRCTDSWFPFILTFILLSHTFLYLFEQLLPTDHYLLWLLFFLLLFIPALSLNFLTFFSIHNLKIYHTLISLLSSLPPPVSPYPHFKYFCCLAQTNPKIMFISWKTSHVRCIWNNNICQFMRLYLTIMNQFTNIVLISSDRAVSLIC